MQRKEHWVSVRMFVYLGQSIQEQTKQNLRKAVFKNFEVIWSS